MSDEEEEAEAEPIIRNLDAPGVLAVGDYVFASRWGDMDPGDPWVVGHVSEVGPCYVVVGDAPHNMHRRFPKAMKITPEQGKRIVEQYPALEHKPMDYWVIAEIFLGPC